MNDSDDKDDDLSQALANTFSRGGELDSRELSQMKQDLLEQIRTQLPPGKTQPGTWPDQAKKKVPSSSSRWIAAAVMGAVLAGLFVLCARPGQHVAVTPRVKPTPIDAPDKHLESNETPVTAAPRVWKLERTLSIEDLEHNFWAAAISPDGTKVVGVTVGSGIVWDFPTGKVLYRLNGHRTNASIRACAFSEDSTKIITACDDQTARIWDAANGAPLATLTGHTDSVDYALLSPDGKTALTASRDDTVRVWDALTGKERKSFPLRVSAFPPRAFSADGKRLILPGIACAATVYDTGTLQELFTMKGEPGRMATFALRGKVIAVQTSSGEVRAWEAPGGLPLSFSRDASPDFQMSVAASPYAPLEFSPINGTLAIPAKTDTLAGEMRLYDIDARTCTVMKGCTTDLYPNCALKFSPDGAYFASIARENYDAGLWKTADGQKILNLPKTTFIAFAPDGQRFVRVAGISTTALEVYVLAVR